MDNIVCQNKTAKSLADIFKGKMCAIYGIDVLEIVDVSSTNLPAITANELRLDNLFLLKGGSYAIVDYESDYAEKTR